MLKYHHCRSLESVVFGEVKANPKYSDKDRKGAYSWLEKQIGFYLLFVAVGTIKNVATTTGYNNQFAKILSEKLETKYDGKYVYTNVLKKKGEFENHVLFSFEDADGVFTDFDYWHIALNSGHKNYRLSGCETRLILKPSYSKADWLIKAKEKPRSVQLVAPKLYLPDAKRIWVRNQDTKKNLEEKGFVNVEVKRIPCGSNLR